MPGDDSSQASQASGKPNISFTEEQLAFCTQIPKIELHAHLNGSIRLETIRELAQKQSIDPELLRLTNKGERTLSECFKLFDIIHRCTTEHATVTRIAQEVVEDFARENVVYLELRTTPKDRPEHGMTKRSYVEAVLRGIENYRREAIQEGAPITVRLILSIDRREDETAARQTMDLATELQEQGVVGIDLSGNPSVGQWASWEGALLEARRRGLKLTLHAGEVFNPQETSKILDLEPERLGHMCYLDADLEARLRSSRIPLELCLSSNVLTESVAGFPDHHFLPYFTSGHPVVLCTDDSGVFNTSLSQEYAIAAQAFNLDQVALLTLAEAAIEYCFIGPEEKEELRARFEGYRLKNAEVGSQKLRLNPLNPALDLIP